jgi:hypothetical protein
MYSTDMRHYLLALPVEWKDWVERESKRRGVSQAHLIRLGLVLLRKELEDGKEAIFARTRSERAGKPDARNDGSKD